MADFQVVNVPGVGRVKFPTTMSDDDVIAAVKKLSAAPSAPIKTSGEDGPAYDPKATGLQEVSHDEPGTWWGGFARSLKDSILKSTVGNPMLQGAANPKTTGDFLSLALPSGVPNLPVGEFADRSWQAVKSAAQDTTGISKLPTLPFRAIGKFNNELPSTLVPGKSLPGYPKYSETPPPPSAGPAPSSLGESAPVSPSTVNVSGASATPDSAPPQAAGIRPPQQPINELVPPSRSSAGAGRDGLTEADRAAAGINPAMTITKVPETTAEMINRARGARRQNYIKSSEEESVRQSSMARDPQEPANLSGDQLQELLKLMRGEP